MKPNGTMNNNSNLKMIDEDEDKEVGRKLSTIVTASMAVQKLQNDQKKIEKKDITIMRRDSQKVDLHSASEKGHYENVKHLLEKKFDPNGRNELSKTPLHLACKSLSPKVIRLYKY